FQTVIDEASTDGPAIAIDQAGNTHVMYRDSSFHLLHIQRTGSSWGSPTTADSVFALKQSLAIDGNGNLHVAYEQFGVGLKYAFFNGTSWSTTLVDSNAEFGIGTLSIAVDGAGHPRIAYRRTAGG